MRKTCRNFFHPNLQVRIASFGPSCFSRQPLPWHLGGRLLRDDAMDTSLATEDHRFDAKQHVIVREAGCFVDRQKLKRKHKKQQHNSRLCVYVTIFVSTHQIQIGTRLYIYYIYIYIYFFLRYCIILYCILSICSRLGTVAVILAQCEDTNAKYFPSFLKFHTSW